MDYVDSTGAQASRGRAVDLEALWPHFHSTVLPGPSWLTCSPATCVTDLSFLHRTFSLLHTIVPSV